MFCSKCGNQLNAQLNYCNRCGAPVSKNDSEMRDEESGGSSEIVGYIGGPGFISFIFVLLILVKNQVPEKALIMISLFYLATLFGICYLCLRQGKGALGKTAPEQRDSGGNFTPVVQLPAKDTNQLEEHREPASVTENTTRVFDKVPRTKN